MFKIDLTYQVVPRSTRRFSLRGLAHYCIEHPFTTAVLATLLAWQDPFEGHSTLE